MAQRVSITGVVQGVGFRPFVYNLAERMGLNGWVINHSGGVTIEVEGPEPKVLAFINALEVEAPPLASIESVVTAPLPVRGFDDFEIRRSESQVGRYQLISPDVATCPDCLRELFDPEDRRYRYPFINCTNCGPRFTIIQDIPYDRPLTTMRVFPMCDDCRAEYEDPRDRRFHAQPNACPLCGPRVWLVENQRIGASENERAGDKASRREPDIVEGDAVGSYKVGDELADQGIDPALQRQGCGATADEVDDAPDDLHGSDAVFVRARELLLAGKILAIKGMGGFHLACDATNAGAVATLRARKGRPHKPFAIMVPSLDDVAALCKMPPEARQALTSPHCPIVLLDTVDGRQTNARLQVAENVAPSSQVLGVMIPYTPLHHILLRDVGRPLVMTSGNLTEEPIAKDNDEALRRLAPLADAFLLHNRDIHARYDDSVVQVVEGQNEASVNERMRESANVDVSEEATKRSSEKASRRVRAEQQTDPLSRIVPVRRARGYAPFPVRLPFSGPQIFATGPLLKNTFTLTRDQYAFVSQHIGDLESLETLAHYQSALDTYRHLFRIEPEIVACDLHPDYMSTRIATAFAKDHQLGEPYRIQHHEAHIAACLADNGWAADQGPVIGVALDGTGYGRDGHIWGGEWFVGDYHGFERAAHLAYLPLPGGDAAIRHPWRIAVAYLHALGLDEALPLGVVCPADVMRIRTMVDRELNTPSTSSMGRLFDAVSALVGVCQSATYEAQAAIELEQAIDGTVGNAAAYPFDIVEDHGAYEIQVGPLFEAILAALDQDVSVATISRRFHATVAAMVVAVCQQLRAAHHLNTVALSGGVFQNRQLMALTAPQLTRVGFDVLLHTQVPPNDGGLSLGQAAMAQFAVAHRDAASPQLG
jgi:hydrogenase maturation protein HypF